MKYKVLLLTAITFMTTCLGSNAKNILSIKESITDNAIVYPSSFETNTNEMMENWYLKNYAIIDESGIESRDYGLVSDAEYIRRLKAISTDDIEMPFNQIVKSYIERYVVKSRTLVAQMLGMCPYYMPIFEEALERHQMPLELKYIPIIESALNPNAVSPAGAGGLWQFMITTAKGVGLTVDSQLDERRDPYKSSEKAAVYFKQLYDTYNDWSLAIAAYNCGPGNVNKAIRRAGTDNEKPDFWEIYNYLPRETRGYVPAFIAANYVMNYYQKHNINPTLTKKPLIIDTVSVTKRIHLDQISQVLNIPLDEIQILNPQYRKGVINGSETRPLTLALPSQQIYSYIMAEDRIMNFQKNIYEQRGEVKPGDVRVLIDGDEPPEKIIYHTVTEGEDFIEIADRYGMEYDALKELNNLTSTTLHTGQVLQVINMNSFIDETVMGSSSGQEELVAANNNSGNNRSGYNSGNNGGGYNDRNNGGGYNDRNNGGGYNNDNSNSGRSGHNGSDPRTVPPKPEQPKTQPKTVPDKPQNNKDSQKNDNKNNNTTKNDNKNNNTAKNDNKNNNTAKNDNKNTKNDNKNNKNDNKGNTAKKEEKKPTSTKHKVKEGDNITKISNQYGISQDDLRAANNITGDHIEIGQNLIIPEKGYAKKHPQPKQQGNNNASTQQNNKNKNNSTSTQQNNKNNKNNNATTQQNNKNNKNNTSSQQNNKNNASTQQNNKNNKNNNAATQQNNKNNTSAQQNNKNNKNNNATTQQNNNNKNNTTTQQNNKGNNKSGKKK